MSDCRTGMEEKEKNSGTQVSARQRSSCEAAAGRLLSMEMAAIREKTAWLEKFYRLESRESGVQPGSARRYTIARRLDDAFLDAVIEWYGEVRSEYLARLSDAREGVEKTLKSLLSGSYPEVSVYEAKNAVADYIEDYNDTLPHFFNDQVRVLLTRCTNHVLQVWTDSPVSMTDSPASFKNLARRSISSVIDREYDLDYSGEQLQIGNGQQKLYGSDAEKCIAKSLGFVGILDSSFHSMLDSAINDIYLKCLGSGFLKVMLDNGCPEENR